MNQIPEAQRGAAEQLLALVFQSGAHLWHNRPGLNHDGVWVPATNAARARLTGDRLQPGLFVPAAVALYRSLVDIYRLNPELLARFASYAMRESDWRDLKVACAALLLVQPRAGAPVRDERGTVAFHDDDYRSIGTAMILFYENGSTRMMSPKGVLRVAELLSVPEIARINREAGFGDPAGTRPVLGRWKNAAREWLAYRERNRWLLDGLVKAGFKETVKKLARRSGYKPESQAFFETLGWPQKQSGEGHREVGLGTLALRKVERFDGLSEEAICERIAAERLGYKETVGRLPKDVGLTPAILVTLLPSLSDKDLRIMTPTLESLGLLEHAEIRARWEAAMKTATDQRALNIAKNVRSRELREKLEEAADHAVKNAVADLTRDEDLEVIFLIDQSGSMDQAIEQSKEAISRIVAGIPLERIHIASFNTVGTVLVPKAASRAAVQHMLKDVVADGGTIHGAGVAAIARSHFRVRPGAKLVLIVAGDEAGEVGNELAAVLRRFEYVPAAIALIVCGTPQNRGMTIRNAAAALAVPFSEVALSAFEDPYQVPRVLKAMLDAPILSGGVMVGRSQWLEKVLATPFLELPA